MKKNKFNRKRFLSFNIQRLLLRLSCFVFLLMINCSLIFGQNNLCCGLKSSVPLWGTDHTGGGGGGGTITKSWTISSSLGAQSTIYTVQPEKFILTNPLAGVAGPATCESKPVSIFGTIYGTSGCTIIAKVLPSGGSPVSGIINTCVTLDAAQMFYNSRPYVQRHFDIEPVLNPATATGTVTLYFKDAEFVSYNTNNPAWPAMPTVAGGGSTDPNRSNLRVTQFHGTPTSSPSAPGFYTGAKELIDPADAGITWNGSYWSVSVNVTGFSGLYVHTSKVFMPVKVWLQGAYNTGLARHKNITAAWVGAMNAGTGGNALSQPYSAAPFSYPGTETVASFPATTNSGTDILDWVLLELRDGTTPATVISRRAAFVRCDGRVVDLDGVSDVSFNSVASNNYHLVIRHRNHLAIRTSATTALDASLGAAAPALYDFSTAQANAYQNLAITSNAAMKDLGGGVFSLWGGNANGMTTAGSPAVRASGPLTQNDYLFLISTTLGGDVTTILTNRYHPADMNLDASVRATGPLTQNDYLFLITTVLAGDVSKIISQHQ